MTDIFIDTNIFLSLYESDKDTLKIFDDISKIKQNLVISEQIYDEFLRNRDEILQKLIDNLRQTNKIDIYTTSLTRKQEEYQKLNNLKNEFSQINERLISKLEGMLKKPKEDPIYSAFIKLYKDRDIQKISRTQEIIQKAIIRNKIGNPPYSKDRNSIGDEIIWESLLSKVKNDLLIITRDSTYKRHFTFLKREFKRKTKKDLKIDENISKALSIVHEIPSVELKEFEEEMKKIPHISKEDMIRLDNINKIISSSIIIPQVFEKMDIIKLKTPPTLDLTKFYECLVPHGVIKKKKDETIE